MIEALAFFGLASALILYSGARLSLFGDRIADVTGITRTWIGLTLLAAVTSLPELATGISAAGLRNAPDLAVGDALGSLLFNLLILVWLDLLMGGRFFASARTHTAWPAVAALPLIGVVAVGIAFGHLLPSAAAVGAASIVLVLGYLGTMAILFRQRAGPEPPTLRAPRDGLRRLIGWFVVHAAIVMVAAMALPVLGEQISRETGLSGGFVGTAILAVSTSLPELVIATAAIRLRAVQLALGNQMGSNLFDLVILAVDDVVYRGGVLLADASDSHLVSAAGAFAMTAVVAVGLRHPGVSRARLSWPSVSLLCLYAGSLAALYFVGG